MKHKRVVITNASQISVCGDKIADFWDAILLKKSTLSQVNNRTGRHCYLVANRNKYENKYEDFIKIAIDPLLPDIDSDGLNLIIGSSHGDYSAVLKGANCSLPSHDRMKGIIGRKLFVYCNVSTSCTSSLNAIGCAYRMIKNGQIEGALAGGCEVLDDYVMTGMDTLRALSSKERSNPFSKKRDGTVLGEGCAFFSIKSLDLAIRRKDKILAEIVGYENINDAYDTTRPDTSGWGLISTMKAAMSEASVSPSQVGYIGSHGTGTYYNDITETNAIRSIFGHNSVTSSIKPVIGHTLGACSAFEILACVLALQYQIIPPTLSDVERDENLDLDYCFNASRPTAIDYVVKNSMGFWGTNASIVLKRWQ